MVNSFREMYQRIATWEADGFAIVVTDEDQDELIAEAIRMYTIVRDDRIAVEKRRAEIKSPALRECQLIDGVSRVYKERIAPLEHHLLAQARYKQNKEGERQKIVRDERSAKLAVFECALNGVADVATLDEAAFELLLNGAEAAYNQRKAVEAQEKLEAERLQTENAKLKLEQAAAAERQAQLQKSAETAREREEAAHAELRKKEDAEKAEVARVAEEKRRRDLAPDQGKLVMYFSRIQEFSSSELPTVTDPAAKAVLDGFFDQLAQIVNRYAAEANKL